MTTEIENPEQPDLEEEEIEEEPEGASLATDLETIQSEPTEPFVLSTGTRVKVVRLRTRETLALLKILTRGAGDVLAQTRISADMDPDEFVGIFLGSVILSIPEAEDETIDFVRRMVIPAHFIEDARSPQEIESNQQMTTKVYVELDNPPLEDLIEIVERVFRNEAPHVVALGKRLAALLDLQTRSKAAKKKAKSPKKSKISSERSDGA